MTAGGALGMGSNQVRYNNGFGLFDSNSNEVLVNAAVGAAVNHLTVFNSITTNPVGFAADRNSLVRRTVVEWEIASPPLYDSVANLLPADQRRRLDLFDHQRRTRRPEL